MHSKCGLKHFLSIRALIERIIMSVLETLSIDQRMDRARPSILSILKRAESDDAHIVGLRDEAYNVLPEKNLSLTQTVLSSEVGVHPWNRYESGLDPQEIVTKTSKIAIAGFSFKECANAVCTERQPGNVGEDYEVSNVKLADQSDGQLAPVAPLSLKLFSLTCGHTTQCLRAVAHGVPSTDPMISINGIMSRAKLAERDANFALAIDKGLDWSVIRWQVEQAFPALITLIIEADNVSSAIAKTDSVWQFMWKIHKCAWHQAKTVGEDKIDWLFVEKLVCRADFKNANDVEALTKFVREWSGGLDDPFILRDVDEYLKTLKVARKVPGFMIGKLATMDLGMEVGAVWRAACIKAMFSASSKFIDPGSGESTFLKVPDYQAMVTRLKTFVMQADGMMHEARTIAAKEQTLLHSSRAKMIGILDIRLVCHVLQRPMGFGSFKCLAEIGYSFYKELETELGKKPVEPCPRKWLDTVSTAPANSSGSSGIARLNKDGVISNLVRLEQQLLLKGCEIGSMAVNKKSKQQYTVDLIAIDNITLKAKVGDETLQVLPSNLFDVYHLQKKVLEDRCLSYICEKCSFICRQEFLHRCFGCSAHLYSYRICAHARNLFCIIFLNTSIT